MKITKRQLKRIIQEEMSRVDEVVPMLVPGGIAAGGAIGAGAVKLWDMWQSSDGDAGEALKTQDDINGEIIEALNSLSAQVNEIAAALEDVQFPTSES